MRHKKVAFLAIAFTAALAWPGPASGAGTSLGGYAATALADPVHVEIFEPALPLPTSPQVDVGIGYTKAHTDTGPVSRATASYLWPGDVLGDGFNQLVGNPNAKYTVQVNSRYPATADSPAHNTAQLTDGNGMTTASDGFSTTASVTGLGIAGPNTDLLSGIGKGLNQLVGSSKTMQGTPELPVQVSSTLAGLVTLQNMHSESSVQLKDKSVTATAHAVMSTMKLLAGLITISGLDIQAQSSSDGDKAAATGSVKAMQISIAGQKFAVTDKGIEAAGSRTLLPSIPDAVTSLLEKVGISVKYAPSKRSVQGATGSYDTSGLMISIDTAPLKKALNVGGLIAPLQQLVEKIPKLGDQLGPLLGIGPKIVFMVGDVSTSATAAPAFVGGSIGPVAAVGAGARGGTAGGGTTGGTTGGTGGGSLGPAGGTGGSTNPNTGATGPTVTPVQSTGYKLPGLGTVPRALILGLLVLAAAVGWGMRMAGGFLLGGARTCAHGLATGVPDLRKG